MSTKSKRSSETTAKTTKAIDRPFDDDVLKRATDIAHGYRLTLERNDEVGFVGSTVELPGVFAQGSTPDACVKATQQATAIAVATMLENGKIPPAPACSGKRDVQLNIRLTAHERLLVQEAARRLGFKGIADFVRNAALDRSHVA